MKKTKKNYFFKQTNKTKLNDLILSIDLNE